MKIEDVEPIELTGFWKVLRQLLASLPARKEPEPCHAKECCA